MSSRDGARSVDGAPRVLVVGDEVKLTALIWKALNEQGMPADFTSSGEPALLMATGRAYDVLVLDDSQAGTDPFGVCRRLRANGVGTPILMLIDGDRIDARSAEIDECADDHVAKPFDFNDLFARVQRLAMRERD